jgi:hypothetical protein
MIRAAMTSRPLEVAALVAGALLLPTCNELDCEEADQQAAALLAEFGSCSGQQRCELVPLSAALADASELGVCIESFLCAAALREGSGQEAFISRARDIVRRRNCSSCATKCAAVETLEAFCDPQAQRCKLRLRTMM